MKKIAIVFLTSLLLMACSNPSEKIEGAWKSKKIELLTQKPSYLIFTKDSLYTGGDSIKVNYVEEKGVILVKKVGSNNTIFTVTPQQNPNELEIENWTTGKLLYEKTTIEDVKAIEESPIKIEPKPDPF